MHWIVYVVILYIVYKGIEWVLRKPWVLRRTSKYVLITGCDSGIGHEAAKYLSSVGTHVFAGCYTDLGVKTLQEYNALR